VFAALAVSHWIEHQTGWSIKKFVRTARRYRTVTIKAGRQILTAAEPLPDDLAEALAKSTAVVRTSLMRVRFNCCAWKTRRALGRVSLPELGHRRLDF
jgi:hypothetical protein